MLNVCTLIKFECKFVQTLRLPEKISTFQITAQIIECRMDLWLFNFRWKVSSKRNYSIRKSDFFEFSFLCNLKVNSDDPKLPNWTISYKTWRDTNSCFFVATSVVFFIEVLSDRTLVVKDFWCDWVLNFVLELELWWVENAKQLAFDLNFFL